MAINKLNQPIRSRQTDVQSFAFVVAVAVCVLIVIYFIVSNFTASKLPCAVELDSRINPNTASAASLVRLPGIGISRANSIVVYRNKISSDNTMLVFENSDDLQEITGIGPMTVENINEYLKFE